MATALETWYHKEVLGLLCFVSVVYVNIQFRNWLVCYCGMSTYTSGNVMVCFCGTCPTSTSGNLTVRFCVIHQHTLLKIICSVSVADIKMHFWSSSGPFLWHMSTYTSETGMVCFRGTSAYTSGDVSLFLWHMSTYSSRADTICFCRMSAHTSQTDMVCLCGMSAYTSGDVSLFLWHVRDTILELLQSVSVELQHTLLKLICSVSVACQHTFLELLQSVLWNVSTHFSI